MKESQNTEWKLTWRDASLRWICGLANAEGGVLVLGRNDKGSAVGVSILDSAEIGETIPALDSGREYLDGSRGVGCLCERARIRCN